MKEISENKTFELRKLKCTNSGVSVEYSVETEEDGVSETVKNTTHLPFCFTPGIYSWLNELTKECIKRMLLANELAICTDDERFYRRFEIIQLAIFPNGIVIKFSYLSESGVVKMQSPKMGITDYRKIIEKLESEALEFLLNGNNTKIDDLL